MCFLCVINFVRAAFLLSYKFVNYSLENHSCEVYVSAEKKEFNHSFEKSCFEA